jgi:hypothetical protein
VKERPLEEEEAEFLTRRGPSRDTRERQKVISRTRRADFEGSPEDLREYVDKLSTEGITTPEEYKMILEKMKERKR